MLRNLDNSAGAGLNGDGIGAVGEAKEEEGALPKLFFGLGMAFFLLPLVERRSRHYLNRTVQFIKSNKLK